jgi:hypothetical protein
VLRLEDERAVETLKGIDWRGFQKKLISIIGSHIPGKTLLSRLEEQEASLFQIKHPTISLDPMLSTDFNVELSCLFDIGGFHQYIHHPRFGSKEIRSQIIEIPSGEYILLDDDISTGRTMEFVQDLLPERIEISKVIALNKSHYEHCEIADSRDFLIGSKRGGLMIGLVDNSIGRAPYVLPYVDPSIRCNIIQNDIIGFSIYIWELNRFYFEQTQLRVGDLPVPSKNTFRLAGFADNCPISDVCESHIRILNGYRISNP